MYQEFEWCMRTNVKKWGQSHVQKFFQLYMNVRNVGVVNSMMNYLCFDDSDDVPNEPLLNMYYDEIGPLIDPVRRQHFQQQNVRVIGGEHIIPRGWLGTMKSKTNWWVVVEILKINADLLMQSMVSFFWLCAHNRYRHVHELDSVEESVLRSKPVESTSKIEAVQCDSTTQKQHVDSIWFGSVDRIHKPTVSKWSR